uniref:Kinesin-like domain-containing protein n=1 Tax=Romanomermis culicivorax TaxID=13658 RepID=A0A915J7F1_ROMCU
MRVRRCVFIDFSPKNRYLEAYRRKKQERMRRHLEIALAATKKDHLSAQKAINLVKNSPSALRRCVKDRLGGDIILTAAKKMETPKLDTVDENFDDIKFAYFDQIVYLGCTSIEEPKSETAIENAMKELNDQQRCRMEQENVDVTLAIPYTSLSDEEDEKGAFVLSPQDKNCFKLRKNREKRLQVALQQTSGSKILHVQKCFGLLLAAGRNVKHCDMHLLDLQSTGRGNDDKTFLIDAFWDPNSIPQLFCHSNLKIFSQIAILDNNKNNENFDSFRIEILVYFYTRVYMTVAADVVLSGIHEPDVENLEIRENDDSAVQNSSPNTVVKRRLPSYEVSSCLSATERERQNRRLSTCGRSPSKMPTNLVAPPDDDDSDSDEPLLSGSGGEALGACNAETMAEWQKCLDEWCRTDPPGLEEESSEIINENKESSPAPAIDNNQRRRRPEQILKLIVRSGVPDSLRCKVWPLLAGCYQDSEMADTYRLLLSKFQYSKFWLLSDDF